MQTLSDPTLGLLVEIASGKRFSASDLTTLLMKANVNRYGHLDSNKQELVRSRLVGARDAVTEAGDSDAHRGLLAFVKFVVERAVKDPEDPPLWFDPLREALLADGYELSWQKVEDVTSVGSFSGPVLRERVTYQLLPTDSGVVPLHAEITALEQELASRGYTVALNHYRQAVNAFRQHDYEAANGQLRSMLEDLLVQLATANANYVKPARQGGGGPSITLLKATPTLSPDDGGDLLSGLWKMAHTKGAHPGLSNADESRFRMHVITAMARLLLHRFP
ncbi:hypothetical protein [Micromonospora gifhornensis]|uniref:hypothetical protein n=1 Tax=Micromonospora gifhornensis TaxID=84594 RepID=UPI003D73BAB2